MVSKKESCFLQETRQEKLSDLQVVPLYLVLVEEPATPLPSDLLAPSFPRFLRDFPFLYVEDACDCQADLEPGEPR